jgi:hypothetical protein
MGRICTWEICHDGQKNVRADLKDTWLAHETAIYEMRVTEGELWTGKFRDEGTDECELKSNSLGGSPCDLVDLRSGRAFQAANCDHTATPSFIR